MVQYIMWFIVTVQIVYEYRVFSVQNLRTYFVLNKLQQQEYDGISGSWQAEGGKSTQPPLKKKKKKGDRNVRQTGAAIQSLNDRGHC